MVSERPGAEIYELWSWSRVASTSKLAPDRLHKSEQPIISQDSNLTRLLWLNDYNSYISAPAWLIVFAVFMILFFQVGNFYDQYLWIFLIMSILLLLLIQIISLEN